MCLKVSAVAVDYYPKTSIPLAAVNMAWDQRLQNFQVEIIYLLERNKGNNESFLPIISNKLSITNFFEAYDTFAGDYIETKCPINLVLRVMLGRSGYQYRR